MTFISTPSGGVVDSGNSTSTTLPAATNLTQTHTVGVTTITVSSTTGYPATGSIRVASESISYTGITATTFTGCTRGANGSTASAHGSTLVNISGGISLTDLIITVDSTADFPSSGLFKIGTEAMTYEDKSDTVFYNVIRGAGGTTIATHADNAAVNICLYAQFIGVYLDVTDYSEFTCLVRKDNDSTMILNMDLSTQVSTNDRSKVVSYPESSNGGVHTLAVASQYMRIRITNGVQAQTTMRIQVLLHVQKSKELTSTMEQIVTTRNDVILVRDATIPQWDLAREFFTGRSAEFYYGFNKSVTTSFVDIWPDGGDYPFQLSADTLEINSADSNDSGISTGTLTLASNTLDGRTFTIGGRIYTLQSTLTNVDGNIHVNASAAGTVLNIVDAITLGSSGEGPGIGYASAMTLNTSVLGVDGTGDTIDFTSLPAYAQDNDGDLEVLPTTVTGSNLSFGAATMAHPTGCQTVELHGLNEYGEDTDEIVVLNGTTYVSTANEYIRLNYLHCQTVGTHGGSNFNDIDCRTVGGSVTLGTITGFESVGTAGYGSGEAGMGMFSVPAGKIAYIVQLEVNVDNNKDVDIYLYEVEGLLRSASSFLPRRVLWGGERIKGLHEVPFTSFLKIKPLTDIFFRAKTETGTTGVSVKCQFYLADVNSSGK